MTECMVRLVVQTADAKGDLLVSNCLLLAWILAARVQSEVVPLMGGSSENAFTLAAGAQSAVWVQDDQLHVRWRQRKHAVKGCTVMRSCTCVETTEKLCAVHRIKMQLFAIPAALYTARAATERALVVIVT